MHVCNGRTCLPGEGNPVVTHSENRFYKAPPNMNSLLHVPPHAPDPASPQYAPLVAAASAAAAAARRGAAKLVVFCAADFDFRELAENWYSAARKASPNAGALVYAADADAYAYLIARRVRAVDGSANFDAWNRTRLQRHIQAVDGEKHIAAAAIAAAGLDVLLTESTHVLLRDVVPTFAGVARDSVDVAAAKGGCNGRPPVGCDPTWNLVWLRGAGTEEQRRRTVAWQVNGVTHGMVDFYLRWFNGAHCILQGFGKKYNSCSPTLVAPAAAVGSPSALNNATAVDAATITLRPQCTGGEQPLRIGLLPDTFYASPRWYGPSDSSPARLQAQIAKAAKPAQRDRLNLDRYDAQDFAELTAAMKADGLWFLQ